MGAPSEKLRNVAFGTLRGVALWCPGCNQAHAVPVEGPKGWRWNRDPFKPTLTPSLRVDCGDGRVCHFFLSFGQIQYCGDTTHRLVGLSVDLPDFPTS